MTNLTRRGTPRKRSLPIDRKKFHAIKKDVAYWRSAGNFDAKRVAQMWNIGLSTLNDIRRAKNWPDFEARKQVTRFRRSSTQLSASSGLRRLARLQNPLLMDAVAKVAKAATIEPGETHHKDGSVMPEYHVPQQADPILTLIGKKDELIRKQDKLIRVLEADKKRCNETMRGKNSLIGGLQRDNQQLQRRIRLLTIVLWAFAIIGAVIVLRATGAIR